MSHGLVSTHWMLGSLVMLSDVLLGVVTPQAESKYDSSTYIFIKGKRGCHDCL
jgi:hypothetical protein